jgi:hypothetical protein
MAWSRVVHNLRPSLIHCALSYYLKKMISSPPFGEVRRLPHHSPDHRRVLKSLVWVFLFFFLSSDGHQRWARCLWDSGHEAVPRPRARHQCTHASMSEKTVAVEAWPVGWKTNSGLRFAHIFQASGKFLHKLCSCHGVEIDRSRPASQHLHWTDCLGAVCAHLHSDETLDPELLVEVQRPGQFHRAEMPQVLLAAMPPSAWAMGAH